MSAEDFVPTPQPRFAEWLVQPMLRNKGTFGKVAVAAVLINVLALVGSLFSMTVFDRVLPNNAISSLIGLSIGMAIVVVFDFVLRTLRAYFVDVAGMNVDRDVGDEAFQRLLALKLDMRQGSTGAIAGTMRELETLRDFFASATLTALIDVPFIVLTLFVIWLLGGWVVAVPLAMVPLVIIAALLTYPAMDRLSARLLALGLNKQSVLIETIGGIEMVKASGAGQLLSKRWLSATDDLADIAMRQRLISTLSQNVANAAQTIAYAGIIVVGVFLIESRELTMGALVGCSILGTRSVAPLAQIAQLLSRLTQTRTAYRQLDRFMRQPAEGRGERFLRPARIEGRLEFRNVSFSYPGAQQKALDNINLVIQPGERVALLGRVGSGKSTIARLAIGLYQPHEGMVLLDGTDLQQWDASVLRGHIGTSLQENVLLSGTIRENILLGRDIDDEEMLRIARLTGVHDFVGRISNGYDLHLADRGESLSGGQRQSIALSRALIARPSMVVFDEPTSAMDQQSEAGLIRNLQQELADRTLLMITHRMSLLALVNRVIVMHEGKITMDGPRDEVLRRITGPAPAPAAA